MHLEAAVEQHPVDDIGAYAPADAVGRLQDDDGAPGALHGAGARQAREPGADHDDVGGVRHRRSLGPPVDDGRRDRGDRSSVRPVSEVWALPGYDVQALLGYGGAGEVWRAVELASGDAVALKRLRPAADPAAVAALRREVLALQRLDTPYVVRLRGVVGEGASTVLVLDLATGGSLAALLARRGRLDPSEVVTLAAPLAQALAAAHAEGLVHGDVTPGNVLFTGDGMPLLADLGLARCADDRDAVEGTAEYVAPEVAAGALPHPASDVWALGAVVHHALAGCAPHEDTEAAAVLAAAADGSRAPLGLLAPTAPRPLVEAVERALATDPGLRPSAAELAALLRRAHAAAPIRLLGVAAPEPAVRATHAVHSGAPLLPEPVALRRLSPRLLAAGAAAGLLLLAGGIGWAWGHGDGGADGAVLAAAVAPTPTPTPTPTRTPSPPADPASLARPAVPLGPDWRAVLTRLDALRAQALATGREALLQRVYVPGSPALAADLAALRGLEQAGERAVGVRHAISEVTALSATATSVRLRVVDTLRAYDVTDAQGRTVRREAGRSAAPFDVTLQRTAAGWRLAQISPG